MVELTPREQLWLAQYGGSVPSSTTISNTFMKMLGPKSSILDIGCGPGRHHSLLVQSVGSVIGIDINRSALMYELTEHGRCVHIEANARELPFQSHVFDASTELALFGGVGASIRAAMLKEVSRVIKVGGLLYLAEFARISDWSSTNVDGTPWPQIYQDNAVVTGEYGSFVVRSESHQVQFIAHHFSLAELELLLAASAFDIVDAEYTLVESVITGEARPNWNIVAVRRGL